MNAMCDHHQQWTVLTDSDDAGSTSKGILGRCRPSAAGGVLQRSRGLQPRLRAIELPEAVRSPLRRLTRTEKHPGAASRPEAMRCICAGTAAADPASSRPGPASAETSADGPSCNMQLMPGVSSALPPGVPVARSSQGDGEAPPPSVCRCRRWTVCDPRPRQPAAAACCSHDRAADACKLTVGVMGCPRIVERDR